MFNGTMMLAEGYLDQPYCGTLPSGRWICTITGNSRPEGSPGEHVMALWSDDYGASWSDTVSVEPAPVNIELANAYSMTIVAPGMAVGSGARVYTIYNMNLQNITHDGPHGPPITRVDMMGGFYMRYSDNEGASWSKSRYKVPYRLTSIDLNNEWKGNVTIAWTVDQLKVRDGVAFFAFTKIGKYLLGPPEEMWVMASANLLSERDPAKITWRLLPDGDTGIKPVGGKEDTNLEEAHVLPLTGAGYPGFYMAGRSTVGWLVASHTTDCTAASGWAPAAFAQYWDNSKSAAPGTLPG